MKLLNKNQVAADNALVKKQQIDEGLALARKIDAMRKELLEMENQRQLYIVQGKEQLEKEIYPLQKKIDELKNEIANLEGVRENLLRPLNKEWEELTKKKEEFEQIRKEYSDEVVKIQDREYILKKNEEEIAVELNLVKLVRDEIRRKEDETNIMNQQAEKVLHDSLNKRDSIDKEIEHRLSEVLSKEKRNEFDRQANEQMYKNNSIREQDLNLRERQINDKYETLQRTINRIKK